MSTQMINTITAKSFESEVEVKWCPGCGYYSTLKQVQNTLAQNGIPKEQIVFVSGIGCSGRFPYYVDTYGLHTIHGRATAVAEGIRMINPDLDVWVIIGDGDGFSIGLNHTLQIIRRNFKVRILFLNNQIYGLTKGQYSPTSEQYKTTSSTPFGSLDSPFNPLALVLAAGGTFIARAIDRDTKNLRKVLQEASSHPGTAFVEIYQNCNIFNDKTFEHFLDSKAQKSIFLEKDKIPYLDSSQQLALCIDGAKLLTKNPTECSGNIQPFVHDPNNYLQALMLIHQLFTTDQPRAFGVLYQNPNKTTYESLLENQIEHQRKKGEGDLEKLLKGNDFWEVYN